MTGGKRETAQAVMAVKPGVLSLGEVLVPEPGEYEALVRMDACAICNSTDMKLMENEFCAGSFPVILGHEVISTVLSVGSKVRNYEPGDRVFRQTLPEDCVPEGGRSCWGGFAEYGIVTDEWAKGGLPYGPEHLPHNQQKLIIDVEPALAAGMVTLMETLDCASQCGAGPGKSVAVVGTGPVGQALALFSVLAGANPVCAFGRSEKHTERFRRVAPDVIYSLGLSHLQGVRRILESGGFDIVIEAVGSVAALDRCIELAGDRGTVRVYGIPNESQPYRLDQTERENVKTVGACEGRAQGKLVEYVQSGQVNLEDWITCHLSVSEFKRGFDLVFNREANKVVLTT